MVRKKVISCSTLRRLLEFTSWERQFPSVILHVPVKEWLASEMECYVFVLWILLWKGFNLLLFPSLIINELNKIFDLYVFYLSEKSWFCLIFNYILLIAHMNYYNVHYYYIYHVWEDLENTSNWPLEQSIFFYMGENFLFHFMNTDFKK